jgi:hypothetical protein
MSAHSNATAGDSDVIKAVLGDSSQRLLAALTAYLFSTPAVTILPQLTPPASECEKKIQFFLIFLNFFLVFFDFLAFRFVGGAFGVCCAFGC